MKNSIPDLTRPMADALLRLAQHGPYGWAYGKGRAGGATARMFDRMQAMGLVTPPPYEMTKAGIIATERHRLRRILLMTQALVRVRSGRSDVSVSQFTLEAIYHLALGKKP